jgi:hypothetical protein
MTDDAPDKNPFILIEFAGEGSVDLRIVPVRVTPAMFYAAAMQMFGMALQNVFQVITQGQVAAAQREAEMQAMMGKMKKQ